MDSGDEHEPEGSNNKNQHQRKQYHRHTPHQIQRLEAYARSSFSSLYCLVSFLCVLPVAGAAGGGEPS